MVHNSKKDIIKLFLLENLDKYSSSYLKKYSQSLKNFSEKNVHDLRVCTRRLLAYLSLLSEVYENPYISFLTKDLKKFLKSFNDLRDTQVQILKLKDLKIENTDLNFLRTFLNEQEKIYIKKLQNKIQEFNIIEISGMLFFLKLSIKNTNFLNIDKKVFVNKINAASEELILNLENINFKDLNTVHKLRISLKKYRYLCEILAKLLKIPATKIKEFKKQQTILGEIQDNNVLHFKIDFLKNRFIANKENDLNKLITFILNERATLLTDLENSISQIENL